MSFKDTIKYVYYDERLTYICDKLQTRMRGITIPDFKTKHEKKKMTLCEWILVPNSCVDALCIVFTSH